MLKHNEHFPTAHLVTTHPDDQQKLSLGFWTKIILRRFRFENWREICWGGFWEILKIAITEDHKEPCCFPDHLCSCVFYLSAYQRQAMHRVILGLGLFDPLEYAPLLATVLNLGNIHHLQHFSSLFFPPHLNLFSAHIMKSISHQNIPLIS